MEKLLQNIVKKFIKQIDFNKIQLKKVEDGHADEIDSSQAEGSDYHVYKIKYNYLTIGTVVTVTNRIENTKYLSSIDINAAFRSRGIGGYVLRHWFSGYYIMADNSRAARLYARLGKIYNKFTHKEFEEFVRLAGMRGVYKLDQKPKFPKSKEVSMKRSERMVRNYRDSQSKLVVARRRYKDALRRFRDAEGEEQLSKFKALKAKIDEKFAMFAKDHPDLIKYSKKFAVISARVLSIMSAIVAGGLAAIDIKVIRVLKKHGFELKEIAGMVPNNIALLISSLAAVVLGFAGWAGKRVKEEV